MSIKKQFLKSKDICKVTFRIPAEAAEGCEKAYILGSFNDWQPKLMKGLKDGSHKIVLDLEKNEEYPFRYLLDEDKWLNDEEADNFIQSEYADAENGVVVV